MCIVCYAYAILTLLIPEISGKTQFLIKIFHTLKRSLKVICGCCIGQGN